MNTPQPVASKTVATALIGDKVTVQNREFVLRTVEMEKYRDPVFLDDTAMPGYKSHLADSEMYDKNWCHVRDAANGNAVMERARLVEILRTGEYEVR